MLEPFNSGEMHKFNSNSGFINECNCSICYTAQAYSHFTLERSQFTQLVAAAWNGPEPAG